MITNQVITKKGISVAVPVKTEKVPKKGGKSGKAGSKSKEKAKGKGKSSSPTAEKAASITPTPIAIIQFLFIIRFLLSRHSS